MKRLMISGASGKMGRLIAQETPGIGFQVACGVDRCPGRYAEFPVFSTFEEVQTTADALIDFSSPDTLPALLAFARERRLPCVLGTTGYTMEELELIKEAALDLPIFQSFNMSKGVYALRKLAALAAKLLPGYDIEIIEKHHNQKADSPSGTARSLLDSVRNPETFPVYGRMGNDTRRKPGEIGIHAVRGGTVAGDHEVGFYGSNEILTLEHRAQSRIIFATGALSAASWLMDKAPGLYGMDDLMEF
jgi:4-hydroxy-tetrahydrodipicolinate reductase